MAHVPMDRFEAFQKVVEDQFQEMGAQVATLRTDMGVSMTRIEQEKTNFGEAVAKNLVDAKTQIDTLKGDLVAHTIGIFEATAARFRPTPAKGHYSYNLRDIAKVF